MKISNLVISLLVVGLFVTGLGIFYADIATKYSITDYNDSRFVAYNQLNNIRTDLGEMNKSLTQLKTESGIVDLVGGFLSSGYQALKVTFSSYDYFSATIDHTLSENSNLGSFVGISKQYIAAIVLVLFLFALIGVLVGRDI